MKVSLIGRKSGFKGHNKGLCKKCGKIHFLQERKGRTYEQIYGIEKANLMKNRVGRKQIQREYRFCFCGCGKSKEVKVNSKWRFFRGHNIKLRKISTYKEMYGIEKANEMKNKHTIFMKIFYSNGHPNKNKKYKDIYGEDRANEIRLKQSNSAIKRIQDGLFNPSFGRKLFKHGHFFSIKNNKLLYYRSSLELLTYQLLESLSKVVKYEVEVIKVSYKQYDNSIHNYIVDLLVYYNDGNRDLIEVKGTWDLEDDNVIRKLEAGKNFAEENNMGFKIITEKDLIK